MKPTKRKEKKMFFDRTEAVEAMYTLEKLGYTDISLFILTNRELAIACNDTKEKDIPPIGFDDVENWANYSLRGGGVNDIPFWNSLSRFDYWWIFD